MQSIVKELKQCTRCHSTILLTYFDTNRKGEYYKTCRNCLTRDHATNAAYNETHKEYIAKLAKLNYEINHEQKLDAIRKYKEANKDYRLGTIACECGGKYSRNCKAKHFASIKNQTYLKDLTVIPSTETITDEETS